MNKMSEFPEVYAVKNSDKERMCSQSGGIFPAISNVILEGNGIVYGCIFNENFEAVHARATNKFERDMMRGSKYVQSTIGDRFKEILKDLTDGRQVMFSGTSCQVQGLKKYISLSDKNLLANLICVDLVCHGVPSPLVWRDYLDWEIKRNKIRKVNKVLCRDKMRFGWSSHFVSIEYDDNCRVSNEIFNNLFYDNNILRPSCFKCPYKSINHPGDITIADYWGIEKAAPGFSDGKGISLVLINSEKGREIFDLSKNSITFMPTKIEDSMQKALVEPYDEPDTRIKFWTKYRKSKFSIIAYWYGRNGIIPKIKNRFILYLKRIKNKRV